MQELTVRMGHLPRACERLKYLTWKSLNCEIKFKKRFDEVVF